MKFLVLNFIILIGYFAFIQNNESINDFKRENIFKTKNPAKLTYEQYNENKISVTDHVGDDINKINNYRKEMLSKVNYIKSTLSSTKGIQNIAHELSFRKSDNKIDSKELDELKKRYSK